VGDCACDAGYDACEGGVDYHDDDNDDIIIRP